MDNLFSFIDIRFWLYFLYFFVAVFLAFYVPGRVVLRKVSLTPFQMTVSSLVTGMVLWILQGIIFGYLTQRWLTYGYLLVFLLFWLKQATLKKIGFKMIHLALDPLLVSVFVVGIAIQLLFVWFIGFRTAQGAVFCCFWPDALYHLGVTTQLVNHFPPLEPGMSGVTIHNYHYMANLAIAELVRVFQLPLIHTQYQYLPLVLSFLLGGSALVFAQVLKLGKVFSRWFVFFLYFGGDIIFLLLFLLGRGFNFTLTVSENATTLWFSPPRVFAMVVLFTALSFLVLWLRKKDILLSLLFAVTAGLIIGMKVYIGIFLLAGLGLLGIYFLLTKQFRNTFPLILTLLLSLAIYLPVNRGAGGLFFVGMWRFEDFAVRPAWNLVAVELARQVYAVHKNYLRIFLIEASYVFLYLISLFGIYLVGFIQRPSSMRRIPRELHIVFLSGLTICLIVGLFFLQQTGGANTSQFLFVVYFIGAFYTALAVSTWATHLKKSVIVLGSILLVLLTGTRVARETIIQIENLRDGKGFLTINNAELAGLSFIRDHVPADKTLLVDNDISLPDTCYYVTVFSRHAPYLCGSGILQDHGVYTKKREQVITTVFTGKDITAIRQALSESQADFIYMKSEKVLGNTETRDYYQEVFRSPDLHPLVSIEAVRKGKLQNDE